jgi:uncharacterized protein (TIGR02588 family)
VSAATGGGARDGKSTRTQQPVGEISKWEWVAGAIGLVLVLAAVGFMARAASQPATPPRLVIAADSVTASGDGYLVHFTARNEGRATAASVTVEGELRAAAGAAVRSTTTLDFVPAGSMRRGGLYFASDPRLGALELRAGGYAEP